MAYVAAAAAVLTAALSLTALFAGGEACYNVASMTTTAACQQTDSLQDLCQQTLQTSPPDTAEVTVYALVATRVAKLRYDDTLAELGRAAAAAAAGNDADMRAALDSCRVKYGVSRSRLAAVVDQLFACDFSQARQEYLDAEVGVRSCQDGLQRTPYTYHSLPIFARVSDDHDFTMVAYLLGAIFLGR